MLKLRKATVRDVDLYYNWTNDEEVRKNSFNSSSISYQEHVKWFEKKLTSTHTLMLVFEDIADRPIGQVRIETQNQEAIIGISIDKNQRGRGFAVEMLKQSGKCYFTLYPENYIIAYIKKDNFASYHSFIAAGYKLIDEIFESGALSYKLRKNNVNLCE